jgi:hypothetical protein
MISLRESVSVLAVGIALAMTGCNSGWPDYPNKKVACTFDMLAGSCTCPIDGCSPLYWCQDSPCCDKDVNGCRYGIAYAAEPGHPSTPKLCTGDIKPLNVACGYDPATGTVQTPGGGVGQPNLVLTPSAAVPPLPFGCQTTDVYWQIANDSTVPAEAIPSTASPTERMFRYVDGGYNDVPVGKTVEISVPALGPGSGIGGHITYSATGDDPAPLDPGASSCKCAATFRATFSVPTSMKIAPGFFNFIEIRVDWGSSNGATPSHGKFGDCIPGSACGPEDQASSCK